MKAKVIFASMTGNTEEIANIINDELNTQGIESQIFECTDVEVSVFDDADICVVATYTYGTGELPDEIVDFYDELQSYKLVGKFYGVVGSGDRSYGEHFCTAVDDFEEAFDRTGAVQGADNVKIEFAPSSDDKATLREFARSLVAKVSV